MRVSSCGGLSISKDEVVVEVKGEDTFRTLSMILDGRGVLDEAKEWKKRELCRSWRILGFLRLALGKDIRLASILAVEYVVSRSRVVRSN